MGGAIFRHRNCQAKMKGGGQDCFTGVVDICILTANFTTSTSRLGMV